jgi:hypothetical protein
MPAEVAPNTEIPEKPAAVAAPEGAAPTTPDKPAVPGEAISKEGVAAPKTALEAAQRVMAKGANAAPEAKPQDGTQPPPTVTPKAGEVDEDDSALPFKDHPSWKAMREKARGLSSQNRILTVAKEKNEAAIRDLEPKAKAHDGLLGYFSENNLGQEDVSAGLQIMAAIRNDPRRAYDMLRPVMDRLEATVGAKLPADLQGKVDSGLLDPAIAAELAKARAGEGLEKQRRAEAEARAARDREAREVEERKRSEDEVLDVVVSALNDAEAEWAKGEPDAAKLKPFLNDAVLAMGGAKPPQSADEAKQLFRDAVAAVKQRVGSFTPPPRAKGGNLPVGGASANHATVPKTALEAAKMALDGMRP